ncbi:protease inhibitor I42 family protein [Chloroflexota bacterium]
MKQKLILFAVAIIIPVAITMFSGAKTENGHVMANIPDIGFQETGHQASSAEVTVGDTIMVRLPSSPSSGYIWGAEPAIEINTIIELKSYRYDPRGGAEDDLTGATGYEEWVFTAVSEGACELYFDCCPLWSGGDSAIKSFTLTIVVGPK